ncbi:MAG: XRE family transcriptional regulator [Bacillota bacterium]
MIGERIKLARGVAGLSLRALADKVGVSAQAISKYERGLDIPSSGVLMRLAQALGVGLEFFFRARTVTIGTPAFRKHSKLPVTGQKKVLGLAQEWIERYLEIEELFPNRHYNGSHMLYKIRKPVESLEEVEMQADHLRRVWDIGSDPIENFTELLEDRGVRVGLIDSLPGFDACLFETEDGQPVIVVNRDLPGDRQRFSLAHELGHAALEPLGDLDKEKAAHRFAGAFLVPAATARRELGHKRRTLSVYELGLLKRKYGLSMQAWIYRAKDLGILSHTAATNLFKQFRKKGWHISEPGEPIPTEKPRRLERLVVQALSEDIVSESRAAELLGKPLSHLYREVAAENGEFPPDSRN